MMFCFVFKSLSLNYIHLYLECDVGLYGYNCNETCGHCMDKLQCSHVKGTCETGCKAGYSGQTCKEGICQLDLNIRYVRFYTNETFILRI